MSRCVSIVAVCLAVIVATQAQQATPSALKIVVVEGEGGVNIIQQKTAVRPIVEVRDRNDVPVAGASVTFTIAGGGGHAAAFAGGAQTLTITTNAAGQAAASSLNALSSGAFQIQVSAAYQGQVATAAISQTNFATAAAAAQAGASAGGSGATGGAAGGTAAGGGGMSATTIGIVGAVAAGGAVAATQLTGGDSSGSGASQPGAYNGTLNGQIVFTSLSTDTLGRPSNCDRTRTVGGTISIRLDSTNTSGTARVQVNETETAVTGACGPAPGDTFTLENLAVTGGPAALAFSGASTTAGGSTTKVAFKGSVAGNTITGTLGLDTQATATRPNEPTGFGSTSFAVTLSR